MTEVDLGCLEGASSSLKMTTVDAGCLEDVSKVTLVNKR